MVKFLVVCLFSATICIVFGASEVRYNVGGPATSGFDADPSKYATTESFVYVSDNDISGILASHRWAPKASFSYEIPVSNGLYDVTLHWAEVYPKINAVGKRIFNVALEGKIKIKNLDVFNEVGFGKLLSRTFKHVNVSDGALTIMLAVGSADNPMLSGLEIKSTDGKDFSTAGSGKGESEGKMTQGFDHRSHAVAGGPYTAQDFNNDKEVDVTLDGSLSHSHWYDPKSGETGKIVKFEWEYDGKVISKTPKATYSFPLGESEVTLTVEDQTGDVATAVAKVIGKPGGVGGVYCYFYSIENDTISLPPGLENGPRPEDAASLSSISFPDIDSFPYFEKEKHNIWAARCISKLYVPATKMYEFALSVIGSVTLRIDGKEVISTSSGSPSKVAKASVPLGTGGHAFELVYYKQYKEAELTLKIDGDGGEGILMYDSASVIPVIRSLSVTFVSPSGGGQFQIVGSGFFNSETVKVGEAPALVTKSSSNELVVGIPSRDQAGGEEVAKVVVCNGAGCSNVRQLTFSSNATKGIQFSQTFFKDKGGGQFSINQVSSAVLGPDGKYYFGTLSGVVHQVDVDKSLTVVSSCQSESLGSGRVILGVAFNPLDTKLRLYASTSSLYWGFGTNPTDQSWANGAVETLELGCGCLCKKEVIISGLPVSNHDHAVNGLEFTNTGDLFILVGGFTNAGHNTPGNKLGGFDENPLSAACLLAKLSKGDAFDGKITYDQYSNPGTANQVGGMDVTVYATGLRNAVDLALTTDGLLFATDNGDNADFGDKSVTCSAQEAITSGSLDEVNLLVKGGYFGHPNRNRGRKDSTQCTYKSGIKPLAELESSSDGIIEYTSFAFDGELKGDILVSKYAVLGTGKLYRLARSGGKGSSIAVTELAQYSGLSMTEGLHGEVVMPRVQQAHVAVLQPVYSPPKNIPFLLKVTPRRAKAGDTVIVTGNNLDKDVTLSITFGGKPCTSISAVTEHRLNCVLPTGTGIVEVLAKNSFGNSVAGVDFIYV